jgi:hypothetical protein
VIDQYRRVGLLINGIVTGSLPPVVSLINERPAARHHAIAILVHVGTGYLLGTPDHDAIRAIHPSTAVVKGDKEVVIPVPLDDEGRFYAVLPGLDAMECSVESAAGFIVSGSRLISLMPLQKDPKLSHRFPSLSWATLGSMVL